MLDVPSAEQIDDPDDPSSFSSEQLMAAVGVTNVASSPSQQGNMEDSVEDIASLKAQLEKVRTFKLLFMSSCHYHGSI